MREIKFEYGFESINGIVKKVYSLSEIPFIADKCDVWNKLPIKYVRQFTGLLYLSRAEVFEGDIMYVAGSGFGVVIYDNDRACFGVKVKDYIHDFCDDMEADISFVYYGDIHSNPELL